MDMYTWICENYGLTQQQYEELSQIKKDIIYNNYIIYRKYPYRLTLINQTADNIEEIKILQ